MQLIHDRAEGHFFIRAIRDDAVVIIDRELRASFLIAPDRIVEAWPIARVDDLDAAAVQTILELNPEVAILGTGRRQQFPDKALLLPLLRQGIGVEVMDNSAAGRTYNLLAGEGRKVVAAFILPG
ncbi:MAG: Mth938-like domain-containing protein [Xanthomonadales bacterium]|uniref:Mth938-like domain-containing protein n=1 Tax=Dokdonella sp. TaxID=2291710 RepID=UPI002C4D042F|nr:Mth938-like domain-containing protein [Xanthomonadales bacterium]HQV73327.1 Mth938-like domain-containing protein [Dokdonella sp.]MBK7011393.1 Mth938-like domain-containing protein [Xanthomonadales bacterium]MBK7211212.1 Mth938-like domain-containing protein [Xanthomonadales bacterium]MBL0221610.1 Mth938-like domain-containing protein [Xanthomonadales bacterium]